MQPAIIRGERRMLRIVNVPLSTGAVAGFAVDVQDLEDARTELARYIESQRELADRMTAGTAQFDADRTLELLQPAVRGDDPARSGMAAEQPEFDRVIDRMRDNQRLPETRDFPAGRKSGVTGSPAPTKWSRKNGCFPRATISASSPSRFPMAACDCSSKTGLSNCAWPRPGTRCFGSARRLSTIFTKRSACSRATGGFTLWNRRFIEDWELDEEWLGDAIRASTSSSGDGAQARQSDRRRADPRNGAADDQ